jgi:hypothetical protein
MQGKIKGSYTPEKMLEFFRRGTLSASQLLLGIDQNLPYSARQVRRAGARVQRSQAAAAGVTRWLHRCQRLACVHIAILSAAWSH